MPGPCPDLGGLTCSLQCPHPLIGWQTCLCYKTWLPRKTSQGACPSALLRRLAHLNGALPCPWLASGPGHCPPSLQERREAGGAAKGLQARPREGLSLTHLPWKQPLYLSRGELGQAGVR